MNAKKRDIKFIIYQSLYIFLICIVAIKGADISLDEVEVKKLLDPRFAYVDTTNKILMDRNELSKMIIFDSTKYMIVSIEDYRNNPEKYISNPIVQSTGIYNTQNPVSNNTTNNPENLQKTKQTEITDKPIITGNIQLVQFHDNPIQNKNGFPITVKGNTIPANSTKTVRIDGDANVVISSGQSSMTIATIPNKKPEIKISPITPMGENSKASQLQRTTCFRVTISDDFPEQLDVKFSGPVSVKQKDKNTYDITMNFFGSMEAYKNFTDSHESPYRVGFNVIVKDKIAPHSVTSQQQFVFGEW
jgi:hypothetical protein